MPEKSHHTLVVGAGPAGLTAAWELARLGSSATVYEMDDIVGGISRTATYRGYRFDIGGHRFFTKVDLVQEIWEEILGDQLLRRPRLSRIYYDDTFFDYPLKPMNALRGLGLTEAIRVGLSYVRAQAFPSRDEENLEDWVSNRFGRRLYEIFFKTYTEKVWGIPCTEIGAEWAAQRIKNLDLGEAVKNALLGGTRREGEVITSLIEEFWYPRLGPGQMWERCVELLAERGVETHLGREVVAVHHEGGRVRAITTRDRDGREERVEGDHVLSTMPIRNLLNALDPAPPDAVLAAANRLRYRDFLTVVLIVDRDHVFPDNWIYIHSAKVRLGRIQNFKNWSPDMVPDPGRTALGLEYFVQEGDELWAADDDDLVALGTRECDALGLIRADEVLDGTVIRMPKAYPIYDREYRDALGIVRGWLTGLPNLQLIGRNGQHRYNNQDHSMLTGVLAARNIHGQRHDVWEVNTESAYHEEERDAKSGDRLIPERIETPVTPLLIARIFAKYDPLALGVALGVVASVGLFAGTAVLLLKGGERVGATLSLLGNYLPGYQVTWIGALVGLLEALVLGFAFGYVLAVAINLVVTAHETTFRRELELMRTLD